MITNIRTAISISRQIPEVGKDLHAALTSEDWDTAVDIVESLTDDLGRLQTYLDGKVAAEKLLTIK